MSETDDTDVLLLIPPNFFLVNSSGSEDSFLESSRTVVHKPVSCTAHVLGKLVDHVHSLETRLDTLEFDTSELSSVRSRKKILDTHSLDNRSLDRKCFTFPRRRRRKYKRGRSKDVSLNSLDTDRHNVDFHTPKSTYNYKLDEFIDTQSMDGDISSIVSTPSKNNDKLLLHEIDEFLTRVDSYESPESKNKDLKDVCSENIIKATGDYISQKLDGSNSDNIQLPSGRIVSSNILDKYIYLVKNSAQQSPQSTCSRNLKSENDQSNINSSKQSQHEAKPQSIRKLNFSENKDVQPTSTPKRSTYPSSTYSESFKPSSNKILDRASKVLEHYKSQSCSRDIQSTTDNSEVTVKRDEFKMPKMRSFGFDHRDFKLDSIDTDLLSLSELWGERGDRGEKVDSIKLEEERLKREHCEAMIQQLQRKILEQQEKLAVAIKVDRSKDAAINKLREAWLRLTSSLDRAEERHRSALDKMVLEVDNFKMVAGEAQKKTSHFETELYKALDLAHDYQEKCKQLVTEKKGLQEDCDKALASKDELLKQKENEIGVLKENYETVMSLNKQSTDCVRNLEDALAKEKLDHESTKTKMDELNQKLESLNDQQLLEQQERDVLKAKVNEERSRSNMLERQLCDSQNQISELLKKCDSLDNEAKSLQKLLEIQKAELKSHYQQQLEDAVLGKLQEFQRQLDVAERDMELAARNKEAAIVETFNKQITRIEEQHKLEVNVLEEKQKEEIKLYRLQLAQANEKISLLESKLETYRRRRGQIASQLHSVMEAQWRQALLILTNGQGLTQRPGASLDNTAPESVSSTLPEPYKPEPLSLPREALRGARSDLQLDSLSDHELQQYVKLLLTKPPSFACPPPEPRRSPPEEPTSDRQDAPDRRRKHPPTDKPPWKA